MSLRPRYSDVPGKVPTTADLIDGELACNRADKKLYQRFGSEIVEYARAGKVVSISSSNSITLANGTRLVAVNNLATAAVIEAPTGAFDDGAGIVYRIKDNGAARILTWNPVFRPIGLTLPSTTVAGKTMYVGTMWNANTSKFDVIALRVEA